MRAAVVMVEVRAEAARVVVVRAVATGEAAKEAVVMVEAVRVVAVRAAVEREEAPAPRRSDPSACSRS